MSRSEMVSVCLVPISAARGRMRGDQKMIWTLTAWQVEESYSELVLEGLKTTLFCEPDMQSANESVSPLRARKGWPVPWPAGSVSACV